MMKVSVVCRKFDDYGIINKGDVINGFTVEKVESNKHHLCQYGDLYKERSCLPFVSGTFHEIERYLKSKEKGNKMVLSFGSMLFNTSCGLVLSLVDGCDAPLETTLFRCFKIALENVITSTESLVITNGFSLQHVSMWAKLVQRINDDRILLAKSQIRSIGIINWDDIAWGPIDFCTNNNTLDSGLHFLLISQQPSKFKQQQYDAMDKVENLLSKQSGGLYDNETRLPRILIVYGGKLHALRKVISALASSIPVLIIKGSGGVADILVQIKVLRDDFYVARSVHVFEQDDTEDARKMIETLKVRKSLIERLWITDIEEFESNVVRIAFWEESKIEKIHTDNMCKNIIRSGNRMLLSVLKHPDLINHLDRKMTKEMLLFLYSNIPKGAQILNSLNTRSSMQGFPELDLQMINQVNIILKSQLQIKGCYYKLTVEEKMTYRDLFVWYLLTEQTEPAFHIWMYSNVLPIWDALLCSFILDGMKHIIYGQKTITLFKHLSREYVQHSTNILHECYINEEYPDSKDIVEHVLFEKPYEIFLHAYNKKKEVFLHHRSITDIIYRRWYGNRLHGTQSPKVVKIVQAVLFFLILPFCLLLLPFLALFKEEFLRRIMNSYNTAFIKCCYFNVSYTAFMCALTVTVLSGVSDPFSWTDLMLLVWSACFALEEGRQIVAARGNGIGEKFRAYIDWRNTVDLANVILFFIGMILKYFNVDYLARVILVANLLLFFLRILDLTSVSRRLGVTYVVVKTLIVRDLIPFLVIVFIIIAAFGIADLALLNQSLPLSWTIIDNAMGKQYWIMYGDNNVDDFDTSDSKISVRLVPYLRGTAALIFFVLLFNTLIAMFTDRYQKIITQSKMHWLYNFVELIDDYEEKSILPPPFVMLFTPHMLLFGLMWCFTIPFQSCSDPRHKHSLKILTRIFCKCRLRNLKRGSDFFVKFYLSSAVKHKPQFTEKRIHNILSEIKKKYIHRLKKSDMTRKR